MNRDNYDMQLLKTLQKISRNLERIANAIDKPCVEDEENKESDNPYQE